jgi:hypothetical protein
VNYAFIKHFEDLARRDLSFDGCVLRIGGFSRFCRSVAEDLSKPWSTLPGVDETVALAPADADAVPQVCQEQ